jgi:tetratricopeptide (TPR) repeat protein
MARPLLLKVFFGSGRQALSDARRALACRPEHPRLYHLIALPLPPLEQVTALREGLARAESVDPQWIPLLRYRLADAFWHARDFAACARELEEHLESGVTRTDDIGLRHDLLCRAYEAMGEYEKAAATYEEILLLRVGDPGPEAPISFTDEVESQWAATMNGAADAEELREFACLAPIAGLVRTRMRSGDFDGAIRATVRWQRYLPEERVRINLTVLDIFAGRPPADVSPLLPAVAACAAEQHHYRFLAGVLFAHAGRSREAIRYLERFRKQSAREARFWGAREAWERARAAELIERLRRSSSWRAWMPGFRATR